MVGERSDAGPMLTVVTAERPATLGKSVAPGAEGGFVNSGGGRLAAGTAERAQVAGLAGLAELLRSLRPSQALIHGITDRPCCRVLSRREHVRQGRPPDALTRTRDCFA